MDRELPQLIAVGTDNPSRSYSQPELVEMFDVGNPKVASLFKNSHIRSRRLVLPEPGPSGKITEETSLELAAKHKRYAVEIGTNAINRALEQAGLTVKDIDYLACVTSTGFLCPSLTAIFIKEMGMRPDVHRIDIVGMGCNGGLNGMQPVVNYAALNPKGVGLLLCVEICSAAYVFDGTLRTAVVNLLFGDGAAAAIVSARPDLRPKGGPKLLGFQSHIIPDAIDAMRFDFDGTKQSFFLAKEIPYVIGANVAKPVDALLAKYDLKRRDITHWVVHSGGQAVIDSIKMNLNLTSHDVRHTESVLREFGNVSSCSFLFSYSRLAAERVAQEGERIVLMTMGPGSTIETCLGVF